MAEEHIENGQEQEAPKVEETKPEEAENVEKADEVKPEEVKPEEVKPEEVKPEEVKPDAEEKKDEEKTEAEDKKEATPELLKQIKDQIEFYFGDVNMQRDKFLNDQTKLDEGWVPFSVMMNFKMLAALSKDIEMILKALEGSELIEISEDKKKIRRSPKLPLPAYDEEYKKAQEEKSVYVKGFAQEGTDIVMLKEFFEPYGPVEHIYMRRYKDKTDKQCFKGSVFVQFSNLDAAKSFMALESVKLGETELIRKWSKDYTADKAKEREEIRAKRDSKKKNKTEDGEEKEKEKENGKDRTFPKGAIIHIAGLTDVVSREDIKEEISKLEGNVAFIEYKKGEPEAWVRLQEGNAKDVFEKFADGKLKLDETSYVCRVLEGDEEEAYLEKVKKDISSSRNNYRKPNRKRGHHHRSYNNSRNETPNKKTKFC